MVVCSPFLCTVLSCPTQEHKSIKRTNGREENRHFNSKLYEFSFMANKTLTDSQSLVHKNCSFFINYLIKHDQYLWVNMMKNALFCAAACTFAAATHVRLRTQKTR